MQLLKRLFIQKYHTTKQAETQVFRIHKIHKIFGKRKSYQGETEGGFPMKQNATSTRFLNDIYRNTESGIDAILTLLPKTQDDRLTNDLQTQLHSLRAIEAETVRKLKQFGETPRETPMMQKMGMKMGIHMNTMMNKSSSRLAELMIKGNNMGVIDLNRAMNEYGATNSNATSLAQELLALEQKALDRFKSYL